MYLATDIFPGFSFAKEMVPEASRQLPTEFSVGEVYKTLSFTFYNKIYITTSPTLTINNTTKIFLQTSGVSVHLDNIEEMKY